MLLKLTIATNDIQQNTIIKDNMIFSRTVWFSLNPAQLHVATNHIFFYRNTGGQRTYHRQAKIQGQVHTGLDP